MKVAVIGSRTFPDLSLVRTYVRNEIGKGTLLISGGAKGVDESAERAHVGRGGTVRSIRPEYDTNGKQAPLIRNVQIVSEADKVVVFWDGNSSGTYFVIRECIRARKHFEVFFPS